MENSWAEDNSVEYNCVEDINIEQYGVEDSSEKDINIEQ